MNRATELVVMGGRGYQRRLATMFPQARKNRKYHGEAELCLTI